LVTVVPSPSLRAIESLMIEYEKRQSAGKTAAARRD
jgi:hypothetical protein